MGGLWVLFREDGVWECSCEPKLVRTMDMEARIFCRSHFTWFWQWDHTSHWARSGLACGSPNYRGHDSHSKRKIYPFQPSSFHTFRKRLPTFDLPLVVVSVDVVQLQLRTFHLLLEARKGLIIPDSVGAISTLVSGAVRNLMVKSQ
jgi:hypothetical protein